MKTWADVSAAFEREDDACRDCPFFTTWPATDEHGPERVCTLGDTDWDQPDWCEAKEMGDD